MTEFINKINGPINSFVWGPIMLVLLVGFGIYMTTSRTGFFQIRKCSIIVKNTVGSISENKGAEEDGVSPYIQQWRQLLQVVLELVV